MTLAVLRFCICFFRLILVFVLQWFSLHWVILVMLLSQFPINFPSNSRDTSLHCIAYDYSRVDRVSLCDHLRDVPWEDL